MRWSTSLKSLLCVAIIAATASAGPVYLSLMLNPVTDADAAGTLDGTSTRSGPGTWHMYAWDRDPLSQGIATYYVAVANITGILNRTPSTLWTDGLGDYDAGFRLLRTPNDTTPPVSASSNPMSGAQPIIGTTPIDPILGFGKESSDFVAKIPLAIFDFTTSPSWGDYATDPPVDGNPGLFIAEGTWDVLGPAPTITEARFRLWGAGFSIIESDEQLNQSPAPLADFNRDHSINAADYVVWRKTPAAFGGDPGGYNTWRENYGEQAPGGGSSNVPEPTSLVLIVAAGMILSGRRSRLSY